MTGVQFPARAMMGLFVFTITSRPALGPTQSASQCLPGNITPEINLPVYAADYSHPSSTKVKNAWSYTSTPPVSRHGVVLR
jgi:hypothetical protein